MKFRTLTAARPANSLFVQALALNSTTSISFVSTGGGGSVLAQGSALFLAVGQAIWFNSNGLADGHFAIYVSTVGVPLNGAAPNAGDVRLVDSYANPVALLDNIAVPLVGLTSGLSVGVTYFFYLAFRTGTGTTLNMNSGCQFTATEL